MSGIFSGKYGLITMRDMFRWAMRYTKSNFDGQFYDWEQQLADDGKQGFKNFTRSFSQI